MKKFSIAISLFIICLLFLVACDNSTPHVCESKCPTCNKCTDLTCNDDACSDKCQGHEEDNSSALDFIENSTTYLSDANNGISTAVLNLGSNVQLNYAGPSYSGIMTQRRLQLLPRMQSPNKYILLLNTEEIMMCAKCGNVEVTTEQKYCDECKKAMETPTQPTKQYSSGSDLEQYIIFNSVARKIKLIIGETEYYTEHDFPFATEEEIKLIGTIKFEGEFIKLIKELENYSTTPNSEGFYILENLNYADGVFDPETGDFDKTSGGKTLISKEILGYKYSGNTLTTFSYTITYDLFDNSEIMGDKIYKDYTLDNDNFYYQEYIYVNDEKEIIDMFDIIKVKNEDLDNAYTYYIQMVLNLEEITGQPAVYFEEAMDIADQWDAYVKEKMLANQASELPTKVYTVTSLKTIDLYYEYQMYYFRDYDYAVGGHESSLEIIPDGEDYEYVRGESAPLPASWSNGFETDYISGLYLEEMIKDSIYEEYNETIVFKGWGQGESSLPENKYSPFRLQTYEALIDLNSNFRINTSFCDGAEYTFTSSDESIATVDPFGYIQSYENEGNIVITVQRGKLIRYFYLNVRAQLVNDSPEQVIIRLDANQKESFDVHSNWDDISIEYSSDDENVVTIDEYGVITAVAEGATAVRATTSEGKTTYMIVIVTKNVEFDYIAILDDLGYNYESIGTPIINNNTGSRQIVTYDIMLETFKPYTFIFNNLDIDEQPVAYFFVNDAAPDNAVVEISDVFQQPDVIYNYRNITFNEAGNYKISLWLQSKDGYYYEQHNGMAIMQGIAPQNVVILEINVSVEVELTHRYDESTNTFYVKDDHGLYAWRNAACIDPSTNLVLEANIELPNYLIFDVNKNGEMDSNWSAISKFTGTIEGNGYYIYGLIMDGKNTSPSFINHVTENSVIKNLHFQGGSIKGIVVTLFQHLYGTLVNCSNSLDLTGENAAPFTIWGVGCNIIACVNYGTITGSLSANGICKSFDGGIARGVVVGCINYGTIIGGENYSNGISGKAGAFASFYGNFNAGTIQTTSSSSGYGISMPGETDDWYPSVSTKYVGCYHTEGIAHEGTTLIDGEAITIEMIIDDMNAAIESYNEVYDKYDSNYRFELNTDPGTYLTKPIIIVSNN